MAPATFKVRPRARGKAEAAHRHFECALARIVKHAQLPQQYFEYFGDRLRNPQTHN